MKIIYQFYAVHFIYAMSSLDKNDSKIFVDCWGLEWSGMRIVQQKKGKIFQRAKKSLTVWPVVKIFSLIHQLQYQ